MIYLSGPMAGYPDHNYNEFNRIARLLRNNGHEVFSPAELARVDGWEWADYVKRDIISMLLTCNTIALMNGYQNSNGSYLEFSVAKKLGFQIYWVDSQGKLHDGSNL